MLVVTKVYIAKLCEKANHSTLIDMKAGLHSCRSDQYTYSVTLKPLCSWLHPDITKTAHNAVVSQEGDYTMLPGTRPCCWGLTIMVVSSLSNHLSFLRKGDNDRRKYFVIKSPLKNVPNLAGVKLATSWSPVDHTSNWNSKASRLSPLSG